MEHDHKEGYPSFNGLSRVAMIKGVPLLGFVGIIFVSVLTGGIAAALLGAGGILFLAIGVPLYLFVRMISANDDRAINVTLVELYWRLRRRFGKRYNNTLTLSPIQYGRSHHEYEFPTSTGVLEDDAN